MRSRWTLALVFLVTGTLMAQTFRGTILGTVTDATGAFVTGATVKVRNVATGLERTTQTTADGSYAIPELPIGSYEVTITQSGFQTSVTRPVDVNVAGARRVDAKLKPGQVNQTVEVSGEQLSDVETTSAELGGILTTQTIEEMPVNGRDYTKLIYMNPGIAGSPDQISDSPGSFGEFSMNGSRGRANNFLLDGTDMNDGYRNDPAINEAGVFGDPATILPIDAVAELRVLSNYEAEYGRNSGAVVNIVTKSGTNQWHGTALEYWRSGQLGARNYFNFAPDPKNSFLNNQFGGSFGGPIRKDKTFFYVDYEGQRETGAQSGTSCVPDPAVIAATEKSIDGTLNPVTQALLARNPWPKPNIPGAISDAKGCSENNLAASTHFRNRVDSLITKIDHNFNANNLMTGRYYFGDSDQSFPFAQLAAGILPGFNTVTPTRVQLVSLSYVKIFDNNRLNEARLGWNRFAEGFFPEDRAFNPSSIGLNTGVGTYEGGLPAITVSGFSQIGATNGVPRDRVDANWHFLDNFSWKSGRHDIKFGYEFRRTTIRQVLENTFRGKLGFDSITDPLDPTNTLSPLAAFLEGLPSGGGQRSGNTLRHTFENSHGFYVQDSFRWTPKLTLNLGLRWDYFGVPGEKNNLFYRFDPNNTDPAVQNTPQVGQLYEKDYNNFAPRLSVAYDVTGKGKTVVRAGWGLFYDAFAQDIFLGHFPWNCFFCPGPAFVGHGPGAIFGLSPRADASGNLLPLDPNLPVFDPASASPNGEFFGADPKLRTPYTQNFNLNIQQALTAKAVLQVGYV
ncbi:MAG TPA: TonB-dependent receptor, partial [Terriglobales bacterium]|nr:TonB-dependent receptor [Terriglobales bacterium]